MEEFPAILLFAQAEQPAAPQEGQAQPAKGADQRVPACGQDLGMLPFLIGMVVLFYFLMVRPQSRERQRRTEMLSQLKKNDKVVTIGGIIGVVSSIHAETDEVVIRVDETNNTKLRVLRSSIHQVITDETEGEKSSK